MLSNWCVAAALLVAASVVGAADTPSGAWLDVPLKNWNHAGAALPKAPAPQTDAELRTRCGEQWRPPSSAADRALVASGWSLFGALQMFGPASLITAAADVDGMCRPMAYQGFVFVDDRFAGTISPRPMDSRSDGAETQTGLVGSTSVFAEMERYKPDDPLCCPTRQSVVTYQIEGGAERPVLAPLSVSTQSTTPGS